MFWLASCQIKHDKHKTFHGGGYRNKAAASGGPSSSSLITVAMVWVVRTPSLLSARTWSNRETRPMSLIIVWFNFDSLHYKIN